MKVDEYMGHGIWMRGPNHYACPKLKLFGFESVRKLQNAIKRKVNK